MRYLHFLAMTYLASNCLRKHPRWLQSAAAGQFIALGQQSLPIFMLGTCLSFLGGVLLDGENPGLIDSAWVNLAGLGLMLLAAQLLNWLDRKPWKNAGNATAFSLDTEWPKQAMLAFGLAFLTIAPLLFLHAQPADIGMVVAPIPEPDLAISGPEELSADAETLNTEEVAFQPQENPIELPDTL